MAFTSTVFIGAKIAIDAVLRSERERAAANPQSGITAAVDNTPPVSGFRAVFLGPPKRR